MNIISDKDERVDVINKQEVPMATQTVPISARIAHKDAEFLSQIKVPGAKTPSDKLRAILSDARRRSAREKDYRGTFQHLQEILGPVVEQIRQAELTHGIHSELVTRTLDWLPDAVAYLVAGIGENDSVPKEEQLFRLEQGLGDRLFGLMESILHMGITKSCPCYDGGTVLSRIDPILQLAHIIQTMNPKQQSDSTSGQVKE
jgi:hypothetical protein